MKFGAWMAIAMGSCGLVVLTNPGVATTQAPRGNAMIQTGDIERFWTAYDAGVRDDIAKSGYLANGGDRTSR